MLGTMPEGKEGFVQRALKDASYAQKGLGQFEEDAGKQQAYEWMSVKPAEMLEVQRFNLADLETGELVSIFARKRLLEPTDHPGIQAIFSENDAAIMVVNLRQHNYTTVYAGPDIPRVASRLIENFLGGTME